MSISTPTDSRIDYESYIKVRELVDLQKPESSPVVHDEFLFIITHQAYELWFRMMTIEVQKLSVDIEQDKLSSFHDSIVRLVKIQKLLNQQLDILETMTAHEFNIFRDHLRPASGFQSDQFRLLEIRFGLRKKSVMKYFESKKKIHDAFLNAIQQPSVYDLWTGYLARLGFQVPEDVANRNYREEYAGNNKMQETILEIYKKRSEYYPLVQAMEAMIDFDESFALWRYRHVLMVQRMIGVHRGTGGSSGYQYLSTTLSLRFFTDLWQVRNLLGTTSYGEQ